MTWTVAPPSAGSFAPDGSGIFTTETVGAALVTADLDGQFQADATLSVTAPVLESLQLQPLTASIARGDTAQFSVAGVYSDGSFEDRTATAVWRVGDNSIANVVGPGLLFGKQLGSTTIDVEDSGLQTSGTLDVGPARLVTLSVSPADTTLPAGVPLAYSAEGTLSDATVVDLTDAAEWKSSNPDIASISTNGLAQGLAEGSSLITAAIDTVASTWYWASISCWASVCDYGWKPTISACSRFPWPAIRRP